MVFLEDSDLEIATKKETGKFQQPPKIKGKHFRNLEYLADASLNWLTPADNRHFPADLYNSSLNTSYFEQCFDATGKLGEGSFGSVMKATSRIDRREYAVKMAKEPFKSDVDRGRKLMEVNSLRQFSSHPNIVTLYEAWEEDRHLYLQLELCLFSLDILEEPMTDGQCWSVLLDISSALNVLHGQGVGHFDVKPGNIQLGLDKKYKLGDFGLAYNFSAKSQTTAIEGDAKYLAPELLAKNEFTDKADIFSLAISILELAGSLALPTHGNVWQALRNGALPRRNLEHISKELYEILAEMMAPTPKQRPFAYEILRKPPVRAESAKDINAREMPTIVTVNSTTSLNSSTLNLVSSTPYQGAPAIPSSSLSNFPTPSPVQNSLMDTNKNQLMEQQASSGVYYVPGVAEMVGNANDISYSSPSSLKFGFSPVKISDHLREQVQAKKRRKYSMTPRNLSNMFKDDDSSSED